MSEESEGSTIVLSIALRYYGGEEEPLASVRNPEVEIVWCIIVTFLVLGEGTFS